MTLAFFGIIVLVFIFSFLSYRAGYDKGSYKRDIEYANAGIISTWYNPVDMKLYIVRYDFHRKRDFEHKIEA